MTFGKNSKGPWALRPGATCDIIAPDGKLIATAYPRLAADGSTDPDSIQEAESNARIIAASLDLLDAIKASRAILTSILGTEAESRIIADQIAIIDAAIAKAEADCHIIAGPPDLDELIRFIRSITDASGPYRYLDGTQIVVDARAILSRVELAA